MTMPYKLVIFDWEGTIVDSAGAILEYIVIAEKQSQSSKNTKIIKLVPDVLVLIELLFNMQVFLAIASNKNYESLSKALEFMHLKKKFNTIRCAGQTAPKPCPQMLNEILIELSISPNAALMIGDSVQDIEMAKSINMDVIGIDIYQQNTHDLLVSGAMRVFNNYKDIIRFLSL